MMNNKNIVLIGFMGCGKTTIGKELAKNLSFSFIETDIVIEQEQNKTINQIFSIFGEQYFRELEKQTYLKVSNLRNYIISTGGGVVKYEQNIINLKKNGIIIYLKATPEKIYENLKYDNKRPLLNTKNKYKTISTLLNEREPLYAKYSDIIFEVNDNTPFVLARDIKNYIQNR